MDVRHRGEAVVGAHVAAVLGRSVSIAYVDEWPARRPGFLQGMFAACCGSEYPGGSRGRLLLFLPLRLDATRLEAALICIVLLEGRISFSLLCALTERNDQLPNCVGLRQATVGTLKIERALAIVSRHGRWETLCRAN